MEGINLYLNPAILTDVKVLDSSVMWNCLHPMLGISLCYVETPDLHISTMYNGAVEQTPVPFKA